jgi:hypothetical protein
MRAQRESMKRQGLSRRRAAGVVSLDTAGWSSSFARLIGSEAASPRSNRTRRRRRGCSCDVPPFFE